MLLYELLESDASDDIWDLCWHHFLLGNTVGEASYAAVPYLVEFVSRSATLDWNALALISAIDLARPAGPAMPARLKQDYHQAIHALPQVLANHPQIQWDDLTTRYAASCISLGRGQREFAKIYAELSLEEGIAWMMNRER